jgi:hypothetical protein
MIPNTNYPEKAASMADLINRIRLAPDRLAAALEGLTADDIVSHPIPGKWSIRECAEHISGVSIGWSDMFFESIEDFYTTPRTNDVKWRVPLETELKESIDSAVSVYRRHCNNLADLLSTLSAEDFTRKFKPVSWLTEPFQINESINWGVVIHCDYHLVTLHRLRTALGKPLDWMAIYTERYQIGK